jgi:hypothetical protein
MDTPFRTPTGLNEQHLWGGTAYPDSPSPDEQPTLIGHQDPAPVITSSSQARFFASSSDNLFQPPSGAYSSLPYSLPPIFHNPAYNLNYPPISRIPINRDHLNQPPSRLLPYPSTTSSYNNPSFTIPPQPLPQQTSQPVFDVPTQPPLPYLLSLSQSFGTSSSVSSATFFLSSST